MKKLRLLIFSLAFVGCSTTIVYAPKHICIHGKDNSTAISGSDLKGNQLEQTSQTQFNLSDAIKKAFGF